MYVDDCLYESEINTYLSREIARSEEHTSELQSQR